MLAWVSLLLLLPSWAAAAGTGDVEKLEKKVRLLERRLEELSIQSLEGSGTVRTYLRDTISLGGYAMHATAGIWGPDTRTQVSATFNALAVNLGAELTDEIRLSSQLLNFLAFPLTNAHNDPRAPALGLAATREFGAVTALTVVPQAYVEYRLVPEARLQFGLGYVPFGNALQQLELVLFRRTSGPQLLSANGGRGTPLLSTVWNGAHLLGEFQLGEGHWGYDLYTLTPASNPRTLGAGTRAWWQPSEVLRLGVSQQTAKRGGDTFTALGVDARLEHGRLGFEAEAAVSLSRGEDPWTAYLEPYFKLVGEELLVFAAIDYLSNAYGETGAGPLFVADPFRKLQYGGGLNWLPIPYARLRLELLVNDYVGDTAVVAGIDRDYCQLDFSAGISF